MTRRHRGNGSSGGVGGIAGGGELAAAAGIRVASSSAAARIGGVAVAGVGPPWMLALGTRIGRHRW